MLTLPQRVLGRLQGSWITPSAIYVRQDGEWLEIPTAEISAVKTESLSRVIVRLYDGRRFVLELHRTFWRSFAPLFRALHDALKKNEQVRGLWDGSDDATQFHRGYSR